MRTRLAFALALLPLGAALGEASQSSGPETVEIPCGSLRLKALLWTPKGAGSFPAVLFNHGSGGASAEQAGRAMAEGAERLGPRFVKHGFAFLYLFRRGYGLSANQAPYLQDLLEREEASRGTDARQHLQYVLLTTDYLEDVTAALTFLKHVGGVDSTRIAVAGHSFGGQLALLEAERDSTVRAAVTFGAAAASWERSPELRERLLAAVRKTAASVMLIHAENDFSTAPGRDLAVELERLNRPHLLKIYPRVGKTAADGHNAVYEAIPSWEGDVFAFLDEHVRR